MVLKKLITYLEEIAPLNYQEDYDNSGLICGNPDQEINAALISLDCIEAVIDEAIRNNCQLVISHHPIVFKGLKKFTGKTYIERTIIKAIKNNIAIYAIHTNLDNVFNGVNKKICEKIGLQNLQILIPKTNTLKKLVTYAPVKNAEEVLNALFLAGAGQIANYSECSFNSKGTGTFKANDQAKPFVGTANLRHDEPEQKIELIYPTYLENQVLRALFTAHPYEEVAYQCLNITNKNQEVGTGMFGQLPKELPIAVFLQDLKEKMNLKVIRHTKPVKEKVQTIAVCGGSGSSFLQQAILAKADVFITADFKYHEFFDANEKLVIADIGHFESEQFTQHLLLEIIQEKFPNFAIRLTEVNTNPINYLS